LTLVINSLVDCQQYSKPAVQSRTSNTTTQGQCLSWIIGNLFI